MYCSACGKLMEKPRRRCPECGRLTEAFWLKLYSIGFNFYSASLLLVVGVATYLYGKFVLTPWASLQQSFDMALPLPERIHLALFNMLSAFRVGWLLLGALAMAALLILRRKKLALWHFLVGGFALGGVTWGVLFLTLLSMPFTFLTTGGDGELVPQLVGLHREVTARRVMTAIIDVNTAQRSYREKYPEVGFACSLDELGWPAGGSKPDRHHAGLIWGDLAKGTLAGYAFRINGCSGNPHSVYQLTAVVVPGQVFQRGPAFCSDQSGALQFSRDGDPAKCLAKIPPAR